MHKKRRKILPILIITIVVIITIVCLVNFIKTSIENAKMAGLKNDVTTLYQKVQSADKNVHWSYGDGCSVVLNGDFPTNLRDCRVGFALEKEVTSSDVAEEINQKYYAIIKSDNNFNRTNLNLNRTSGYTQSIIALSDSTADFTHKSSGIDCRYEAFVYQNNNGRYSYDFFEYVLNNVSSQGVSKLKISFDCYKFKTYFNGYKGVGSLNDEEFFVNND